MYVCEGPLTPLFLLRVLLLIFSQKLNNLKIILPPFHSQGQDGNDVGFAGFRYFLSAYHKSGKLGEPTYLFSLYTTHACFIFSLHYQSTCIRHQHNADGDDEADLPLELPDQHQQRCPVGQSQP